MTVAEQVRQDLHDRRQAGQDFAYAWAGAIAAIPRQDRPGWVSVLDAHEPEWRAAYERRDLTPHAAAVATIGELWEPESADRAALAAR